MANNALPAIQIEDDSFYTTLDAQSSEVVLSIDVEEACVSLEGCEQSWPFQLSHIEWSLLRDGGAMKAFDRHGAAMWDKLQE